LSAVSQIFTAGPVQTVTKRKPEQPLECRRDGEYVLDVFLLSPTPLMPPIWPTFARSPMSLVVAYQLLCIVTHGVVLWWGHAMGKKPRPCSCLSIVPRINNFPKTTPCNWQVAKGMCFGTKRTKWTKSLESGVCSASPGNVAWGGGGWISRSLRAGFVAVISTDGATPSGVVKSSRWGNFITVGRRK